MKKYFFILFIIFSINNSSASIKENIINNIDNIENISFNFEQNINDKIERGRCTIQYPKKIFCKYDSGNQKVLVSDGKSIVIKTTSSYYIYPLKKTALELILDKDFLIKNIREKDDYFVDDNFVGFKFLKNENEINIFFDKKNFFLIGWQMVDLYQNLSITYISSILVNQKIKKNFFTLPIAP